MIIQNFKQTFNSFRVQKRGKATGMVEVQTILAHIAKELRQYSGLDNDAAIEEFVQGSSFDFHLAITRDVRTTELDFTERYGKGHIFYFRVSDYEQGKLLAGQFYWILLGVMPEEYALPKVVFSPNDQFYLFIQVQDLYPPAIQGNP